MYLLTGCYRTDVEGMEGYPPYFKCPAGKRSPLCSRCGSLWADISIPAGTVSGLAMSCGLSLTLEDDSVNQFQSAG